MLTYTKKQTQKFLRISTLLLLLVLVFTMLCACNKDPVDDPGSDSGSESESTPAPEMLKLVSNGVADCQVIYGSSYGADAAISFASFDLNSFGISLNCSRDTFDEDSSDFEILFGETNREESKLFGEVIRASGDWCVKLVNNKLVVVAGSAKAYAAATEYLKTNFVDAATKSFEIPSNLYKDYLVKNNEKFNTLSSASIVYAGSATSRVKKAASAFASSLSKISDAEHIVKLDSKGKEGFEIVVGTTNRRNSNREMFLYDYYISYEDDAIYVEGGCSLAIEAALNKLLELINENKLESYENKFDTSLFNPLAFDQSSFVPVWANKFTVPEWMTDFNEKLYALTNPSGRPMAVSHRSDRVNYPENSIEGCLSAAMLGTDVIEMDLYLTKDNVLVLCHNSTLDATTNVAKMKGKNGLPTSNKICDWTYAELQQLNLLTVKDKEVTEYKMPTFYEVLCLLRDKCFVMVDRKAEIFDKDDVMEHLIAADNLQSAFYSMFVSAKTGPGTKDSHVVISQYSAAHPENTKLADYCAKFASYMAMPGHSKRARGWLTSDASTDPSIESFALYEKKYNEGLRLIYTNNIELLSQFIAKYEPDLK